VDNNVNHIISKFKWDTSFDRKEHAFELQERISNWSKTGMPRDLIDVFDNICPVEQTWRIKSLEIDLGEVDFDNLEFDLSAKLRWKLNERLVDMIMNANQNLQNIELVNESVSRIELIREFLLHGIMQWNYQVAYGSVNEMLSQLLHLEPERIISLVKETGTRHESVRRRIAWQFAENNIIGIIKGLEPDHHNEVIEFSDELVKIQQKENVVRSSANELKKNIWFWILNFLLNERGTLFNRVAFMKSTLKQMAAAYNISYDELLDLIESAVNKLNNQGTVKADFLITLKMLFNERKAQEQHFSPHADIDYLQFLENYFRKPELRRSAVEVARFNELVVGVSKQYQPGFRKLVLSFGPNEKLWSNALTALKVKSFKAIVISINPTDSNQILSVFDLLNDVAGLGNINPVQTMVLCYLQTHSGTFNQNKFFSYFNKSLGKSGLISRSKLWVKLIEKKMPYAEKTILNSTIFSALIASFDEAKQANEIDLSGSFKRIIDAIAGEFKNAGINKTVFMELRRLAMQYIAFYPETAFKVFINYHNKTALQKLLPYITDTNSIRKLIQAGNADAYSILLQIIQNPDQFKAGNKPLQFDIENLFIEALNALVFPPQLKGEKLMAFVLDKINGSTPTVQFTEFDATEKSTNAVDSGVEIKSFNNYLNKLIIAKSNEYLLKNGTKLSAVKLFQYIKNCIENNSESYDLSGIKCALSELVNIALEEDPQGLRTVINSITCSDQQIRLLKSAVSFSHFSLWILSDVYNASSENMQTIWSLFNIARHFVNGNMSNELLVNYWTQALNVMDGNSWSSAEKKKLITNSFSAIANSSGLTMAEIIYSLKKNGYTISPAIYKLLSENLPATPGLQLSELVTDPNQKLARAEREGLLDNLIEALIIQKQIPVWFDSPAADAKVELLNEIITHYPQKFLRIINRELITGQQMHWLGQSLNFKKLIVAIAGLHRPQQSILHALDKLYQSFSSVSISGITSGELQYILFKKLIKAWSSGNWEIISAKNIWNELLWEVCNKKGVSHKDFFKGIEGVKFQLPAALQVSYKFFKNTAQVQKATVNTTANKTPKLNDHQNNTMITAKGGITVKNAGAVLLNNYIAMLFERLGLINNKTFSNAVAQAEAVHYLQYVITGLSRTEESLLVLNKVLCGVPIAEPVQDGITISPANVKLIEGMITAIIGYWPAIGQCSVDGFRGNWLVRDGLLVEQDERWELTVEKRAYDLLINKSPFSFSIIKYPWMAKPLHVNWTY
jgi:hypothetical protein